ncbi:MAG: hypothetical protein WAW59_08375 [Patescibacteria group bacterium]
MLQGIDTGSAVVVVGAVLAGSQAKNLVGYLTAKLEQVMSVENADTGRIILPPSPLAQASDMSLEK